MLGAGRDLRIKYLDITDGLLKYYLTTEAIFLITIRTLASGNSRSTMLKVLYEHPCLEDGSLVQGACHRSQMLLENI